MQKKNSGHSKLKSGRWHTVYSIISTLIEEAAIAAALVWVLPLFGITIPVWAIILVLVGFAIISYIMYRIGHPTVLYHSVSSPESIIGQQGIVERSLNPGGYVKVGGELWNAYAQDGHIEKGEDIIVVDIKGLTLTVIKKGQETPKIETTGLVGPDRLRS